jgi:hypothetical protein
VDEGQRTLGFAGGEILATTLAAPLRTWSAQPAPGPGICPFLVRSWPDGEVPGAPDLADDSGTCAALEANLPVGALQQASVCLAARHLACPRYAPGLRARASQGDRDPAATPVPVRLAWLLVAAAAVIAMSVLLFGGGIRLPAAPTPTPLAAAVTTATPTPRNTSTATSTPPATLPAAAASPSPSPTALSSPTPTPLPSASANPAVSPSPAPAPTTGSLDPRYRGLAACPAPQTCYVYIAKAGSTVYSIASYFGASQAGILDLNPQIPRDSKTIYVGESIRIPPPE